LREWNILDGSRHGPGSGIVKENVEAPELLMHGTKQRFYLFGVADIDRIGHCLSAPRATGSSAFLKRFGSTPCQNQLGLVVRKCQRGSSPNSRPRSRNQNYLSHSLTFLSVDASDEVIALSNRLKKDSSGIPAAGTSLS
jgi:hypothetical protein